MQYVTIARLGKPFGLKGQVHALSLTSFPELRFEKNKSYVLLDLKGNETTVTLTSFSIKGDALVLGFKEITSPEQLIEFVATKLEKVYQRPEAALNYAKSKNFEFPNLELKKKEE